jgi:hypothetical protein
VIVQSVNGQLSEVRTVVFTVRNCGAIAPTITQVNRPPVPAEGLAVGEVLSLSVVSDAPNDDCGIDSELNARWTISASPIGSSASLSIDSPLSASIVPDIAGVYTLTVFVEDQSTGLMSERSTVSLEVGACGATPPSALVGATAPTEIPPAETISLSAYTCQDSNFVQLDASGSEDFNVNTCGYSRAFSYQWSVQELSPGLTVSIAEPDREAVNLSVSGLALN